MTKPQLNSKNAINEHGPYVLYDILCSIDKNDLTSETKHYFYRCY